MARPGHRWQDLDAPYFPRPGDEERDAVIEQMRERAHQADLPTPRRRLVVAATADQRFLGEVGWYWESEPTDWRRMGIALYDPGSWGRGLGTRAMRLWTSYLFATTEVRRLDFATWSGNGGMLRIGQRLGFTEEARFRQARPLHRCRARQRRHGRATWRVGPRAAAAQLNARCGWWSLSGAGRGGTSVAAALPGVAGWACRGISRAAARGVAVPTDHHRPPAGPEADRPA